jgi:hypothetical protein
MYVMRQKSSEEMGIYGDDKSDLHEECVRRVARWYLLFQTENPNLGKFSRVL